MLRISAYIYAHIHLLRPLHLLDGSRGWLPLKALPSQLTRQGTISITPHRDAEILRAEGEHKKIATNTLFL